MKNRKSEVRGSKSESNPKAEGRSSKAAFANAGARRGDGGGAAGAVKRPPLERMKKIYGWLHDGAYPNCCRIVAEFEVARKTALRDIEFLRDRMGLPIEYDGQRHGYYFTGPVDGFPGVPFTEKELFGLSVVHKAIEQYRWTPLHRPLELVFQRFAGQLDDRERSTLQNLDEGLSFRPFAPEDGDLRLFELVSRAVTERRALRFQYRKPGAKSAEAREVHPYHLMEFEGRWYLLAQDLSRGAIRKFVLGRMREPVVTGERFVRPKDFDPKQQFDTSLGVMSGKGDYEVVIEMDAWLADVLRGRRWHPSQVVTDRLGGGSQLRLRLSCLEEIEQNVLSWGTHARVVGPAELVERVASTARGMVARYRARDA